jgi:hypothetical protein
VEFFDLQVRCFMVHGVDTGSDFWTACLWF